MNDHRWESLDPADEAFVDEALRAGREDVPDEARLRLIEGRLGGALEKEAAPSWWSRSRLYPVVGLAVVALGIRAGASAISTSSPSGVSAAPATAAPPAPVPAASAATAIVSVSVESLPPAHPAPSTAKASAAETKPRSPSVTTAAPADGPDDELGLLEAASLALETSPERALSLTDEHMKRFRAPKFAQERERLAVVALVRLGRREDAKRRAEAFEAAFPRSAHLTRVRELVHP